MHAIPTNIETGDRRRRAALGQFLTPGHVADFMASLFEPPGESVRLLDAGAGAGALTAAFVRRTCDPDFGVRSIEVSAWEVDPAIRPRLHVELDRCREQCRSRGVRFRSRIHESDFVQATTDQLADRLFEQEQSQRFDVAIVNPPYRKISSNSAERRALRRVGVETSNLYAGFVSLILRLMRAGGQVVGITPRSFCNGPYFRPFREDLLHRMSVRRLHVFDSRQAAFAQDQVLQENIVFHGVTGESQTRVVVISRSNGSEEGAVAEVSMNADAVFSADDAERVIHIPLEMAQQSARRVVDRLHESLRSLGIEASTGRVVDFRLRSALRAMPDAGTVPLIYPCHFSGREINWPKPDSRKPNAIEWSKSTSPWLVPAGYYVLTRRFSSKEERRRIVACLIDPAKVPGEWWGIENHLNYFHERGRGLDRDLARGLVGFLNSTWVDDYFRSFSGHTQVNVADLRRLRYPNRRQLQSIGRAMPISEIPQDELDRIVKVHLDG